MDMNNQQGQIGVGEREGRIASKLVYQRHFGFSHGIGRSGDIAENQPKAIGSSLLYKLANKLVLSSLKIAGISKKAVGDCIIFPMATGLTLSFCMQLIKSQNVSAKYVIWPRIDQKSCFKAIIGAGIRAYIYK
ncbi:O-phosphoseryl-tRNA(Sec) selenium transferase [Smittium culicis]|uniref:O-phosphoseryl-tRNA(Sec) selenium transferase n=1 Tax=Smittium culicis TaxID=133412 RepID=A0A1R1XA98_9FUNG|nr:O-phosphoseryl-tRNA(Sec) selenium transferase [Smittium culicis]